MRVLLVEADAEKGKEIKNFLDTFPIFNTTEDTNPEFVLVNDYDEDYLAPNFEGIRPKGEFDAVIITSVELCHSRAQKTGLYGLVYAGEAQMRGMVCLVVLPAEYSWLYDMAYIIEARIVSELKYTGLELRQLVIEFIGQVDYKGIKHA